MKVAARASGPVELWRRFGSQLVNLPFGSDVDEYIDLDWMDGPARDLAARAYDYALCKHEGQRRKGTALPYLVHPVSVARILADRRLGPELVAAGLLHDVVEDTDATTAEVEARFGQRVAWLVEAVTRRQGHRWVLPRDREAALLKAADLANNLADSVLALDEGADVWARFAAGPVKLGGWSQSTEMAAAILGERDVLVAADRAMLRHLRASLPRRWALAVRLMGLR